MKGELREFLVAFSAYGAIEITAFSKDEAKEFARQDLLHDKLVNFVDAIDINDITEV